jgi:GNAT superfamily N-acetyltransferase
VDIRAVAPDDPAQMAQLTHLLEACRRVDAPFQRPRSAGSLADELRFGWDLEPDSAWLAHDGGTAVAHGSMYVTAWDNPDLAWLNLHVHPDLRERGIGREVMSFLETHAQELGRTNLGTDAWDRSRGVGFALARHYDKKSQAIVRRQDLAVLDLEEIRRMRDEAISHAPGYELLRLRGQVPDEMLEDYCQVAASINDAPLDDLDMEDEDYNPQRMRDHEQAMAERGIDLYRVVARNRETGELGGHTAMMLERRDPEVGMQEDTAVAPAHRGRRLGTALKADMLLWLAEVEPQVSLVETWNAESNDHMIAINERLGYRVVARELQFQKRV